MIAIIDYGINETTELTNALAKLGVKHIVTKNEKEIINANQIILSNADNLHKAVKRLHLFNLFSLLRLLKKPTLGISLGMNLLSSKSDDGTACLGLLDFAINTLPQNKIIGMKKVKIISLNELFTDIESDTEFYFSNNYNSNLSNYTTAIVNDDNPFSAAVKKDNFFGVQFLPEKSGDSGLQILKNFSQINF
jgi:glutamine amidotransferase